MRRLTESTGYLEVFAWGGSGMMVVSLCVMVAVCIKVMSDDPGMPVAHAEALVSMAGKHAKQTGDSQGFTANQDRRRSRRTGVREKRDPHVSLACAAPHANLAHAWILGGGGAGQPCSADGYCYHRRSAVCRGTTDCFASCRCVRNREQGFG